MTTQPIAAAGTGLPARFTGPGYYRMALPSRGEMRIHVCYIEAVPEHPDFKAPDPWLSVWLAAPEAGKMSRPVWQGVQSAVEAGLVERIETGAAA